MRRFAAILVMLLLSSQACAAIQLHSGLRGTWWNPDRSGEGFQLDLSSIDSQRTLVLFWYTYDQNGNQVYLFGSARHVSTDTSVRFEMYDTRGGEFGAAFDPTTVTRSRWGEVTLTFTSCSRGHVQYNSTSFGAGQIQVERFGILVAHTCSAVDPTQSFTYPFIKGDWIANRRVDAITSAVTCEIYARRPGPEFNGTIGFFKSGGNVFFSALITATSSVFPLDTQRSFLRVDQNPAIQLSEVRSNARTLEETTGVQGQLIAQMMTGSVLVARMVAQNQFVAVHEISYPLTFFPQVRAAFDACVGQLN